MEVDNTYKSEIPAQIIFLQMKKCSYNFFQKNKFLNINIFAKDYFLIRSTLIDLIKKVSKALGFKSQTFFLSIYYLDIIIIETTEVLVFNNYTSLALACLVVASKYCENDPNVPQLPYFIRVYNHIVGNKDPIPISELIYNEVKICKILNYKLQYYTIYDYNSFFFGHGILKLEQLKEIKKDKDISFPLYAKKILEKIYKKSRNYLNIFINKNICFKYSSLLISIYIMEKSVESIIINESKIVNDVEKIQIKKKTQKYFKEIMNEFYKINYENNREYILLKKEIEPYKNRNKNNIPSISNLSLSNKTFKNNLSNSKLNENTINKYKFESLTQKHLNCLNKNNNNLHIKNFRILTENNQRESVSKEKNISSQPTFNNINKGKLTIKTRQNNDFKYSPNNNINNIDIINNFNNEIKIKNYNYGGKRSFNSIKNLNNISYNRSDEKKNIFNNNFTNKVPSSANFNINKINYLNQSIDFIKSGSNSPKNKEEIKSKVTIYINKKSKMNKFSNSQINKTEGNINNTKNRLDIYNNESSNFNFLNNKIKINESQLMNINKLYYRKILGNNENKYKSHSNHKDNNAKIKRSMNSINHLIKINNPNNKIKLKLKLNKRIDNMYLDTNINSDKNHFNNRYGNIFFSDNDIDNENENEDDLKNKNTKIEVNSSNNYIFGKSYIKKKINFKERNISENKLNLLSKTINEPSKVYDINDFGKNYLDEFFGKNKLNPKKNTQKVNLHNNNFNFESQDENYINTDINLSNHSTSIKPKNSLRAKSKEIVKNENIINLKSKKLLIKQKYSSKKIYLNKNSKTSDEKKSSNQEYNVNNFLGNNDNNNIYYSNKTNDSKNKKFIKNNSHKLNKNKLMINNNINNINNNLNKFDNEIFSLINRNKKNNLNLYLNTTESFDIMDKKNNFKKLKELNSEKNNNKKKIEIKSITCSSNNNKYVNKKINKNIFSTIIIDNSININLNKKKKSKESNKLNFKLNFDSNTYKNPYKNNKIKVLKKSGLFNKTIDINNKNSKLNN